MTTNNSDIPSLYTSVSATFISKHAGDLVLSIAIILGFYILTMRYRILSHISDLRDDWPTKRCNPAYMPFAHLVVKNPSKTAKESIEDNFNYCIHNLLYTIADDALAPLYYSKSLALKVYQEAVDAVNNIRAFFDKIRNDITNTATSISGRTLNITIPILKTIINAKNAISQTYAVFTATIYSLLTLYLSVRAMFILIITIIILGIMVYMVMLIVTLYAIPFVGWTMAIPIVAIFVAIVIAVLALIVDINQIFGISLSEELPHL